MAGLSCVGAAPQLDPFTSDRKINFNRIGTFVEYGRHYQTGPEQKLISQGLRIWIVREM